MSKSNKAVVIGNKEICPKCQKLMERRKHPAHYIHKKSFYYTEWDYCPRCNHVKHYNEYRSAEWKEIDGRNDFIKSIL